MGKYKKLSEDIINAVGGKNNISKAYHCMTRLRFNLNDESLVKKEQLKNIAEVLDQRFQSGQFQVIVGGAASEIFKDISAQLGITAASEIDFEIEKSKKAKKFGFGVILDFISSLFTPLIGVIAGAGILLGLFNFIAQFTNVQQDSNFWFVMDIIGNSAIKLLPILIAVTAAQKLNTNIFWAAVITGVLVGPQMILANSSQQELSFFWIPIKGIEYSGAVFPPIFVAFSLKYLKNFLEKFLPDSIRFIFTPLLCLLILIPLTLIVFGPAGYYIGLGLAWIVGKLFLYVPWLGGIVIGGGWPLIIMTGTQLALAPMMLSEISLGGTYIIVAALSSVTASLGTAVGLSIIIRNKVYKKAMIAASISNVFGITEPIIYTGLIKYKASLIVTMFSGGVFGAISCMFGMKSKYYIPPGFMTLPVLVDFNENSLGSIMLILCAVGSCLLALLLVVIVRINERPDVYQERFSKIKWYQLAKMVKVSIECRQEEKSFVKNEKNEILKSTKIKTVASGIISKISNTSYEIETGDQFYLSPVSGEILKVSEKEVLIKNDQVEHIVIKFSEWSNFLDVKVKENQKINAGEVIIEVLKDKLVNKKEKTNLVVDVVGDINYNIYDLTSFGLIKKNRNVFGVFNKKERKNNENNK